jgi:serine/threonine protein kinase
LSDGTNEDPVVNQGSAEGWHVVGRYSLHAPIAAGGMATVHLARDERPEGERRAVAVKRLHPQFARDPDFIAMFLDEARVAKNIVHPNVVRTLDLVRSDEEVFLVMEYVAGESLARLTRGKKPPPIRIITAVLNDVLQGLHAAHVAKDASGTPLNIVHRDVSPQNILVGADGVSRLLDFGVAKARGRMQETRQGELKGKLAYMAPEHLQGADVSLRTDLYAAGVVLWETLTGKRLFASENEGAVVARILAGQVPSPMSVVMASGATIPYLDMTELQHIDRVVMRALARDPAVRHQNARDMALDICAAVEPAEREDVAAWVRGTAHDVLESRAAIVREIESRADEDDQGPESEPPTLQRNATALLPIIVCDLANAAARDTLAQVAAQEGVLLVPLLAAPVDAGDHLLEVHVPGEEMPVLFMARPAGPPEADGFPLHVRRYGAFPSTPTAAAPPRAESKTGQVAARTFNHRSLTASHTRDLTGGLGPAAIEADVLGRSLGGGELVLVERLGGGGGGAVYRGRHRDARKDVAVKVLHDGAQRDLDFCARFHAEALAASKLDHPNLVRIIDFDQEPDGLLYLTMEYLRGPSLREIVEKEAPLPVERAVLLVMQVCAGLVHAHARDVVHRDIKPSNVILVDGRDDDGKPVQVAKVCDFGIALDAGGGGRNRR